MYHIPPAKIIALKPITSAGFRALSIINIIINRADVPTDAARFPYTANMENKKENKVISSPNVKTLSRANPVTTATKKRKTFPTAIALRLYKTGPGLSIAQMHNAPNDKVKPVSK
jgi:hypothetical protein